MAYGALGGLLALVIGGLVKDLPVSSVDLLVAVAYVLGGIVLGYMGAQIAPEVFKRKP